MNKYRVTYQLVEVHGIIGWSGPVGEYSVEFLAQDGSSYDVAESLKPNNPCGFKWIMDEIVLIEELKL